MDKDIERAAVSTLGGDADAEETKKNANIAVKNNVADVFPDGATSISAALDEIDRRYLLPAMAQIERRREETFKSQGDVARCSSTSMSLRGEEIAMKRSLSENNVTSKISGVACSPSDGGSFHDKKHVSSHAVTRPTGLLGTPGLSKLRATIPASPAQDHSMMVDGSPRSSTSTWLPPVVIEHNVHANNLVENTDEAVHKSYLDHARKLGSLLVSTPSCIIAACLSSLFLLSRDLFGHFSSTSWGIELLLKANFLFCVLSLFSGQRSRRQSLSGST